MDNPRQQLDRLFLVDGCLSVVFGLATIFSPHVVVSRLTTSDADGNYDHNVHELLRLYGCLRLACGWILWHVRRVDDGLLRKHICEALSVCYLLQALCVVRAQYTASHHTLVNWISIVILSVLAAAYGSFRFRRGGNLIKIYELPTGASNLR
mmetsp:Transcript_56634/g.137575  ORF Transcript_56634/g.137575 Transcript_56634/m.137575 type:complete len:152 (+) Transcript_56634:300-755(+)